MSTTKPYHEDKNIKSAHSSLSGISTAATLEFPPATDSTQDRSRVIDSSWQQTPVLIRALFFEVRAQCEGPPLFPSTSLGIANPGPATGQSSCAPLHAADASTMSHGQSAEQEDPAFRPWRPAFQTQCHSLTVPVSRRAKPRKAASGYTSRMTTLSRSKNAGDIPLAFLQSPILRGRVGIISLCGGFLARRNAISGNKS